MVGNERGFTLVELMIAAALTMVVVGAAVGLATRVQNSYQYEVDDAAVQQEARFALDWISRTVAAAGSAPYGMATPCGDDEEYSPGFILDPDDDGEHDDIRVLSDVKVPNGQIGGSTCTEDSEDVTIALGADGTITRLDVALDMTATSMTDSVFTGLSFAFLDADRAPVDDLADKIKYVQISVTVQSKGFNPYTGERTSYTYQSEVRVRSL